MIAGRRRTNLRGRVTGRRCGIDGLPAGRPLWRLPGVGRLMVVSLTGFIGYCLTLSSLPAWLVGRGVGSPVAGLVTTVLLVSTVAVQFTVPALVRRLGTGPVLMAGLLALGLPAPLLLISDQLGAVMAISVVRGCGFAVLTVLGATLSVRVAPPGRRGETVGLYGLAIAIPNLIAIPAGVALVQAGRFGWMAVLATIPVLGALTALRLGRDADRAAGQAADLIAGRPGEVTTDVRPDGPTDPDLCGSVPEPGSAPAPPRGGAIRAALPPSIVLFAVTAAAGALLTLLPIIRPTGATAGAALLGFGITGALTRWRAGLLADRLGRTWLLTAAGLVTVAGMAAVAGALTVSGPAGTALVVAAAALFGAGFGAVQNLSLLSAFARAGDHQTESASAFWNAAFDAGTAVGAATIGSLALGLGSPGAFAVVAALVAVTVPAAVIASRPR